MDDAEKPSLEPLDQCQPNMTQSIIRQRKCLFKRRGSSFPRGITSETAKTFTAFKVLFSGTLQPNETQNIFGLSGLQICFNKE